MDEQLAQTQTIEALRRQVETSNNAARDAQAPLHATQEQQQQYLHMPPSSNLPATTTGNIGNTPFVPPVSTPSTGLCTIELHGPGYYHVGSPAETGYAEQMRAMYGTAGREDIDSLRYDPPRQDPPRYDLPRQDRLRRDQDHPHKGLVPSPINEQYGKVDKARASQHFRAVGSFLLV